MLGSSCFESSSNFDKATCASVKQNQLNGTFRQQEYGAMENIQWEACGSRNCFPDLGGNKSQTCELGRMSEYYVDAESPDDISATVKFVKDHDIRLVIKNTGHDYMGRSSAANTLALRTFKLKSQKFHAEFTSKNCPKANGKDIAVIGAGVTAEEASAFFLKHNMMVTTGGCPSVGLAGGFGQSAGHGPLAPSVGLMVDQAVEFDVVTTDGKTRTINQCNEPELFWAMRGGGAQSYAILTSYKFKVYPSTRFATFHFQANISSDLVNPIVSGNKLLKDILTNLARNQETWTNHSMAGYDIFTPRSVEFFEILTGADAKKKLTDLTSEFRKYLTNVKGLDVGINEYKEYPNQPNFYSENEDLIQRAGRTGIGVIVPTRLVTRAHFKNENKISELVDSMLWGMQIAVAHITLDNASKMNFILHKTAPSNSAPTNWQNELTSVNPVWRDTIWQWATAGGWLADSSALEIQAMQTAARAALGPVKQIVPVQAAYMNEADWEEEDWQKLFYGENYDRLLEVKKKYDPEGVLNCWKCVGWLGEDDQMYSCYK